ncbi:MAG: zinc metalloprotease [Ferruginibacter sp.]
MKIKVVIALISGCIVLNFGCTKTSEDVIKDSTAFSTSPIRERCAAQEVLLRQLAEDPGLARRMQEIEEVTAAYARGPVPGYRSGNYIVIPVWVNVLYNNNAENISEQQIISQIKVLNEDYSGSNNDTRLIPDLFKGVQAGDTHIKFELAGISRKFSTNTEWPISGDPVKHNQRGGLDPTNPSTTLNIWCCDLGPIYLGYAQFPGGNLATDGVVIDDNAFGNKGTATAPYGMGRTATHEVGHWLNLRHIWGDRTCGNDFVDDTPVAEGFNGGCPAYPKYGSCSSTIPMMTMNYMDYTYDACMYMFTSGQNLRMQATFQPRGGRESFAQ